MKNYTVENLENRLSAASPQDRENFYNECIDLTSNEIEKFRVARLAALFGVRDAVHYVVDAYQKGNGVEPSESAAFEWIRKAAREGDVEFYFDLAMAYRDGVGTPRNIAGFWDWMTRAASTMNSTSRTEAMFQLAETHLKPEFGQVSIEKSVEWTRMMADAGAPGAMVRLARQYHEGLGVERNHQEALSWSVRAEEAASSQWHTALLGSNGHPPQGLTLEDRPEALVVLAEVHRSVNPGAAKKYSRRAAEAASLAIELGRKYGMKFSQKLPEIMADKLVNFKNADGSVKIGRETQYFNWLLKLNKAIDEAFSADEDLPTVLADALYSVAVAYQSGTGTKKNSKSYRHYLEKAARAGHGEAAYQHALQSRRAGDQAAFAQSLEIAIAANNMKGLIARALANGICSRDHFETTLPLLESLWGAVDTLRSTRHIVDASDCPNGLAHYTDGVALMSMLAGDRAEKKNFIRLYSTAYVNDPKEGTRLQTYSKSTNEDLLKEFLPDGVGSHLPISWEAKEFHVFIGCFTLQCDNLDLWRFYGRDGKGFGVVTPFSAFGDSSASGMIRGPWTKDAASSPRLTLYRVLYEDSDAGAALDAIRKPLGRLLRHLNKIEELNGCETTEVRRIAALIISELLYLYKDKNYANEREVRAIEARALGDPNGVAPVTQDTRTPLG